MAHTEYVVLINNPGEDGDAWIVAKNYTAPSAESAVRQAAATWSADNLVAVPARSWKPFRVTVETTTRVRVEPA